MTKRKIIKIDEELCNGCGQCIDACSEGALKLVNGKATLVRDDFCDGFGDCLGECPTGALTIEERDAPEFDFKATLNHVSSSKGDSGLKQFLSAAESHGLTPPPSIDGLTPAVPSVDGLTPSVVPPVASPVAAPVASPVIPPVMPAVTPSVHQAHSGGCPGSRQMSRAQNSKQQASTGTTGLPGKVIESDLAQWPVQLHLVSPSAPYFNHKELVILSTCAPVASADVHWRFLRGRSVVVACPKLDRTEPYVKKLRMLMSNPTIPKVLIVRMTVPCCGGLTQMAQKAFAESGRTDLELEEITVDLDGSVLS
jgi:NAD-dependent dihydropyrimidine dehydrogenase PreA subunit